MNCNDIIITLHRALCDVGVFAKLYMNTPHNTYEFERDNKVGLMCEKLSELIYKAHGVNIKRCVAHELNRDYTCTTIDTHNAHIEYGVEIKGDFKSIITDNIFLEFLNTKQNKHSGVMCGDDNCIWHHYFFKQGKTDKIYLLCTTKRYLRDVAMRYKDTVFMQPKSILNARGYAVAQSLFTVELINEIEHISLKNAHLLNTYTITELSII